MTDQPEDGSPGKLVHELVSLDGQRSKFAIAASWLIGILLLAALVVLVLRRGDIELFISVLVSADPVWLMAAFLSQVGTYACAAAIWANVLGRVGVQRRTRDLFGLALMELFANQAMPTGGISGSVIVMHGLRRRAVPDAIAATALLTAALSYYVAYLLVALLGFALLWWQVGLSNGWFYLGAIFVLVIILIAALLLFVVRSRGRFIPKSIRGWPSVKRLADVMQSIRRDVVGDSMVILRAVSLQTFIFMLDAMTLWLALRAIAVEIAPTDAFVSFILASVVATLAPLPLGLGSFEGTCVALLHLFGVQIEAALAGTLVLRGLTFWLPMVPGIWLLRREARVS
ncbi:flippase-like domain-containing protein [Rhizobium sp. P40RR-XXII]|uniref:lysylphosphatidylglycerol synthase transmembrane domain-containing protein n=1 Tax=Rhizobium sp. P40RR-XXII TaxID=2726739 RepID=UPI0014563AB8|nr:lysylphosphatidylglycerol synthase transmembrane domain-containing protein [Rhizobium sp. P40RR-XXII]NLS20402.1 flippase-like domain-containing protein [Rhizobium sp. P40RR-XXII]